MLDLSLLENPIENVYVLKKWNWDYLEAEKYQLECVNYVNENPHVSILIVCSHPRCFTLGRGLQKIKETTKIDLVDFDHNSYVPFPLHQVKRGGGLTFHYPGQLVFYPILNLSAHKKAVFDLMMKIMEITKELLQTHFSLGGLSINRDLLGLWYENEFAKAKIASIGLAVSRFNTYHGMALNCFYDQDMFKALESLSPCGLPGNLYRDIESLIDEELDDEKFKSFGEFFLDGILSYLKPEEFMVLKSKGYHFLKHEDSSAQANL